MLKDLIRPLLPPKALALARWLRGVVPSSQNYHDATINRLERYRRVRGARILVVGANSGIDCKRFVDRGAHEIHGLDVVEDVGVDYPHPQVTYHKQSIESCSLPSDYFDIAYAMATFEHVPDIFAGWSEMVRVTKPGGIVFSVASPLWQSPYGHHMGCFEAHPWIHLAFDREEMERYAQTQGVEGERGHSLQGILDYMLNPAFFNMRPASDYIDAGSRLSKVKIKTNSLASEGSHLLDHPLAQRSIQRGHKPQNMLAVTHSLIAIRQ